MYSEERTLCRLSKTTIADLSVVADTTIYTVPTSKVLFPFCAFLKVAGDVGAALVCSIGQDGAETDFVGNTNGDNLDAANDYILLAPIPSADPATLKMYAAGTVIEFKVATGGNAVVGTLYLFGILDEA